MYVNVLWVLPSGPAVRTPSSHYGQCGFHFSCQKLKPHKLQESAQKTLYFKLL